MSWISQSSMLPLATAKVFPYLAVAPVAVSASSRGSALHYVLPSEIHLGAMVHYKLLCGFQKVEWKAPITFVGEGLVHTDLNQNKFFQYFSANHCVRDFAGQSILRDEFEFECHNAQLEEWFDTCSMQHSLDYRKAAQIDQTITFRAIGEQSA